MWTREQEAEAEDICERRAAQWALRGTVSSLKGSFDESGMLKGDGSGEWVQESTPRLDWYPLILLGWRWADIFPYGR